MFITGGQEVSGGRRTRAAVLSRPGNLWSTSYFNLIDLVFCQICIQKDLLPYQDIFFLTQVRGIGTDIAIVSCMVFLAQVKYLLLLFVFMEN